MEGFYRALPDKSTLAHCGKAEYHGFGKQSFYQTTTVVQINAHHTILQHAQNLCS